MLYFTRYLNEMESKLNLKPVWRRLVLLVRELNQWMLTSSSSLNGNRGRYVQYMQTSWSMD